MGKSTESAGQRLIRECGERYGVNPAEAVLLEHAAGFADLGERLVNRIREAPLEVKGASGQPVANPLHADFVRCSKQFAAIVDALRLPDRPESKMSTSERASHAARARWARKSA